MLRDTRDVILSVSPTEPSIRLFLADMLILNYQWIYTILLVAAAGAAILRRRGASSGPTLLAGNGIFLTLMLVQLAYVATRHRDYNNARYILVVSPLLVAAFYGAVLSLFTNDVVRRFWC